MITLNSVCTKVIITPPTSLPSVSPRQKMFISNDVSEDTYAANSESTSLRITAQAYVVSSYLQATKLFLVCP